MCEARDPRKADEGRVQQVAEREISGGSSRRAVEGDVKEGTSVEGCQRPLGVGNQAALTAIKAIGLIGIRTP
ncbi:MAG: hypothetical protein ACLQGP_36495 [Isosphaeraceae bacterium]